MWERIIAGREGMKPLDCSMHFNAGMQALQTAVHIFRPMGLSPMLAQCLTEFAQFVVSGARVPGRKVNEDGRPRLRQAQASLREAEKYAGILENWIKETVGWRPSDHEEDLEEGDGRRVESVDGVYTGGTSPLTCALCLLLAARRNRRLREQRRGRRRSQRQSWKPRLRHEQLRLQRGSRSRRHTRLQPTLSRVSWPSAGPCLP